MYDKKIDLELTQEDERQNAQAIEDEFGVDNSEYDAIRSLRELPASVALRVIRDYLKQYKMEIIQL